MNRYINTPLHVIVEDLKKQLATCKAGDILSFEVLNPDATSGYSGKVVKIEGIEYLYRSYNSYVSLANNLACKFLTPIIKESHIVEIRLQKLDTTSSFHTLLVADRSEKYGVDSHFFAIHKDEEASFLLAYLRALEEVNIATCKRVLNLGINGGDEFALIEKIVGKERFEQMELVGIDHSQSAIAYASSRSGANVTCKVGDINHLESLSLGRFDLLISIGTLQSPGINFKLLFMSLVQNYLHRSCAIILGFPNSRWIDGELIYGAKVPNYKRSEMGLVIKDIHFCKKYLQQHKFRVVISGRDYIFLSAVRL